MMISDCHTQHAYLGVVAHQMSAHNFTGIRRHFPPAGGHFAALHVALSHLATVLREFLRISEIKR